MLQGRSHSKSDLQKRLIEMGKGKIHGKRGLPGVVRQSSNGLSSNQKTLRPVILGGRTKSTSQLALAERGGRPSSRLRDQVSRAAQPKFDSKYQLFGDDDEVQQLPGERLVDAEAVSHT